MHHEGHPWWNIHHSPVALSMSRCGPAPSSPLACSAPQSSLFCSNPFHFQRPAQVPLPLWSLLFFFWQKWPSLTLHANHFYNMSPSSSVLLFYHSYLPYQPICFLPAVFILTSLSCLMCSECVIKLYCTTVWLSFFLLMFYCWHVLHTLNCKFCEGWNCPWLFTSIPYHIVPTDGFYCAKCWVLH